jgi:MFS family permease
VPPRGRARLTADARRILTVQGLRAAVYGLGSVLIGVSLERRGLSGAAVGLVLAAMLAGAALVSLVLARHGDGIGRRRAYVALLVLMALAGTAFALTGSLPLLLLAALTGTLSTDVLDSGPFASLEQAMLAHAAGDRPPTSLFGAASTVATLAGSLGALVAGGPTLLDTGSQRWLLAYPVAATLALVVAAGLSPAVDTGLELAVADQRRLQRSRPVVMRLSALFALDSFGGGFVVQAFIAYWFAREWGTSPEPARAAVLRRRNPPGALVPGRRAAGRPHRAAAHDGLHAPAVERPARRDPVRPNRVGGDPAPARALRAQPD